MTCADNKSCGGDADCQSGACKDGKCQTPTCADQVKNGKETDVDCGGGCMTKCDIGKACTMPSDCTSGGCVSNICIVTDPYFSSVVLLMHFDGSDGSASFIDVKGHTVTPQGGAQITTAQSKFGGASGSFLPTDGAYLTSPNSTDWDLTSVDSTVELWFYPKTIMPPLTSMVLLSQSEKTNDGVWGIQQHLSGIDCQNNGGANDISTPQGVVVANAWQFLAVVHEAQSNKTHVFINGAKQVLGMVNFYTASTNPLYIGLNNQKSFDTQYGWAGYIDELRITKGVARYTSDFVPPSGPFPDQ